MRRSSLRFLLPALMLALAPLAVTWGQSVTPQPDTVPSAAANGKKVLSLAEYGSWTRITSAAISADGRWMTYLYRPNDGDASLFVRELDGARVDTITRGSDPSFSDDSRWVGYYVNPPEREGGRRGRARTPGPGTGQGSGPGSGQSRRFELRSLETGETFAVPNAQSFTFANGSGWLAVRLNETPPDTARDGADLVLRELATGVTRNIGNVSLYAFDEAGRLLAYTIDAADRLGNGIYLIDLSSGVTTALNTARADYAQMTWSEEGSHLAVLRGEKPEDQKHKVNVLLAWTGLGTPRVRSFDYDPAQDATFPDGMVLSELGAVRWSDDGSPGLRGHQGAGSRAGGA